MTKSNYWLMPQITQSLTINPLTLIALNSSDKFNSILMLGTNLKFSLTNQNASNKLTFYKPTQINPINVQNLLAFSKY